jgi:hypothetical protein
MSVNDRERLLHEPNRNELFAKAARSIGEAEDLLTVSRKRGTTLTDDILLKLVESQQSTLMLLVKLERTQDNLIRSRTNDLR